MISTPLTCFYLLLFLLYFKFIESNISIFTRIGVRLYTPDSFSFLMTEKPQGPAGTVWNSEDEEESTYQCHDGIVSTKYCSSMLAVNVWHNHKHIKVIQEVPITYSDRSWSCSIFLSNFLCSSIESLWRSKSLISSVITVFKKGVNQ